MNRTVRVFAVLSLIGLVLVCVAIACFIAWVGDPLAQAVINVDGNQITLAQLHGSPLLFGLAVLLVLLALLLVLPLALVLPLIAGAMVLIVTLFAVAATAALALSPLILLGWLIWRLTRPGRSATVVAS